MSSAFRRGNAAPPLRNVAGFNFAGILEADVEVKNGRNGLIAEKPVSSFDELDLHPELSKNLRMLGLHSITPVQKYAIPNLMKRKNLMSCSATGSGKTAAFLLPIINNLIIGEIVDKYQGGIPASPQALILAPTRELAVQICNEALDLAKGTPLENTVHVVYGGTNMTAERNRLASHGCNILVATVGRLLDIIEQGVVDLSLVQFFVLDEADEMLERGFIFEIRKLVEFCPGDAVRTTAMFSATYANAILKAADNLLKDHVFVKVGKIGGASMDIIQEFELVERAEKLYSLFHAISRRSANEKILVFCGSKAQVDLVYSGIKDNEFTVDFLHSDLTFQREREEALRKFGTGEVRVLLATSIAARGLDIPSVNLVINYDLPGEIHEYVLRIGRTGRVGNAGEALSFFEPVNDAPMAGPLMKNLKDAKQPVPKWMESICLKENEEVAQDYEQYGWGSEFGRQRNAIGSAPRGVPLPCEEEDCSWD